MKTKQDLAELLNKPLWQMTGEEYVSLHAYACNINAGETVKSQSATRITGVRALSEYLDCCESTVYMLLRIGVLKDAIISRIGKKIVFDGDKARELGAKYQKEQRELRAER